MSAEAGVIPVGMVLVDADGLLSIEQLAEYTGISKNTLYYWRVEGRGPRGMKLGKYVRCRRADVEVHGR